MAVYSKAVESMRALSAAVTPGLGPRQVSYYDIMTKTTPSSQTAKGI